MENKRLLYGITFTREQLDALEKAWDVIQTLTVRELGEFSPEPDAMQAMDVPPTTMSQDEFEKLLETATSPSRWRKMEDELPVTVGSNTSEDILLATDKGKVFVGNIHYHDRFGWDTVNIYHDSLYSMGDIGNVVAWQPIPKYNP